MTMALSRRLRPVLFAAAIGTIAAGLSVHAQDPPKPPVKVVDVAGKWDMTLEMSIGTGNPTLEVKQDGAKLTGTYTGRYGTVPIQGSIADRTVTFTCTVDAEGQAATMNFRGEIAADGQSMRGSAEIEGLGDATWTAKRAKVSGPRP
jgi:hypothetical protein